MRLKWRLCSGYCCARCDHGGFESNEDNDGFFKKLAYKEDDEMVAIAPIIIDGSESEAFITPSSHSGIAMDIQIKSPVFLFHDPP